MEVILLAKQPIRRTDVERFILWLSGSFTRQTTPACTAFVQPHVSHNGHFSEMENSLAQCCLLILHSSMIKNDNERKNFRSGMYCENKTTTDRMLFLKAQSPSTKAESKSEVLNGACMLPLTGWRCICHKAVRFDAQHHDLGGNESAVATKAQQITNERPAAETTKFRAAICHEFHKRQPIRQNISEWKRR